MTTPEQQARDMLGRMGIEGAQNMSAGDVGELANFISRSDALLLELHKALDEFKIIDEMNDQLREQNTAVDDAATHVKALKAELDAIKQEAGEPVAWALWLPNEAKPRQLHTTLNASMSAKIRWSPSYADCLHIPLYTRPCVPLTEEHVRDFVNDVGLDWQSGWTLDECEPNRYVQLSRAVEAHIKGAKP